MSFDADKLYSLLPAVYRLRDAQSGGALRAVVEILADEALIVERDIGQLYDNWFIETCDEWVVPYIGDLLGTRGLHPVSPRTFSQRAWVANTLGYRRRKGTATMLEQLARDVTGWPAHAVEFFERLAVTQHFNHVRLHAPATAALRQPNRLELTDGPFDALAHTGEVRNIAARRGRYNIPNIGLFLWRIQSYPVGREGTDATALPSDFGTARPVADPPDGRYTFSPLGLDGALFNVPRSEDTITHLAEEQNVPGLLRRRALHDELEGRRQSIADGESAPAAIYFPEDAPVLRILWQPPGTSDLEEIPPARIAICGLSDPPPPAPPFADWPRPAITREYIRHADGTAVQLDIDVSVDPDSGRIAFPAGVLPERVAVCFSYGFPGDVGGGPYGRTDSIDPEFSAPTVWQVGVSRIQSAVGPEVVFASLKEAVEAWNSETPGTIGVIALMDSTTDHDDPVDPTPPIRIPEGSKLLLIGADWPIEPVPGSPGATQRRAGRLAADEVRAHFHGDLIVEGAAEDDAPNPGSFTVNGLLLEGSLTVNDIATDADGAAISGNLGALRLVHSTLVPQAGGLTVVDDNERLKVSVERSVVGPIAISGPAPELSVSESIVAASGGPAIGAPAQALAVERSTIFGSCACRTVSASGSIFLDALVAARRQSGCVRFSYLAAGSRTPRRYRCQPDLALAAAAESKGIPLTLDETIAITGRLLPQFTSTDYGHHAYAQLAQTCAVEIRTGNEDGSEMGVWSFLLQPQRDANLTASLDEYLRFGLEAGILYVT